MQSRCELIYNMKLCYHRGQAEKEFRVEVEAIGHVRHKNLVRLLGYCVEGTQRSIILISFASFKILLFKSNPQFIVMALVTW
jgi:hypothetical protein